MQKGCAKCQVVSQMRHCNRNKVLLFSGAGKMVIMELQGVRMGSASVIPSVVEGIMSYMLGYMFKMFKKLYF